MLITLLNLSRIDKRDIINTTTNTYSAIVDYSGLSNITGLEIDITRIISANTEAVTAITAETPITTTLELTVSNPNLADIDLSLITINIYEGDFSGELASLSYSYNSETLEATVTGCSEGAEVIIIPETVEYNGNTYTVTTINGSRFAGNNHTVTFPMSTLKSVFIPETITTIGYAPFNGSGLSFAYFEVPEGWTYMPAGSSGPVYDMSFSDPTTAADTLKSAGSGYMSGFTRS